MDEQTIQNAMDSITDQYNNVGDSSWLEGWICGLTDDVHDCNDDVKERLLEHLQSLRNNAKIQPVTVDPMTIANVISDIQMMKNNRYTSHISNIWIYSFLDELYECGMITQDEHKMLVNIY